MAQRKFLGTRGTAKRDNGCGLGVVTMRYLGCGEIAAHCESNIDESWDTFRPVFELIFRAIDALLLIQYAYVLPKDDSPEPTSLTIVQTLAQRWLYQSVFSFHASLSLAEQGFYTQSMSINRGLIETLVTVLYFADKPDEVHRFPKISKKVSKPITLRERFDQVIPDYYDTHYRFSSELTHPSEGSFVFKLRPKEDGELVPDLGITFDPKHCSMCLTEMVMLLAGFLKAYPVKFKPLLKWRESEHIDSVHSAGAGVLKYMHDHIQLKGEENAWHKATRPLWDWS
jgi:hypothetical protein